MWTKAARSIIILSLLFLSPAPWSRNGVAALGLADHRPDAPAATLTVTSPADAGPGSLRALLGVARWGDVIDFDPAVFPSERPVTITLLSPLPVLSQGKLTLDAGKADVILDGSQTPAGTDGLQITSDQNIIRGLQIVGFPSNGISINGGYGNIIGGNWKTGSAPRGQGNILTRNGGSGVGIMGGGDNTISGNLIGLDRDGTQDIRIQAIAISPDFAADRTIFIGTKFHGVLKSSDGGASWQSANQGLTRSNVLSLAVSPNYRNDRTLFAGAFAGGVFKSESGGAGWLQVSGTQIGDDVVGLAISSNYASDRFVAAATNVRHKVAYVSQDGGIHWNPPTLEITNWESSGISISPGFPADNTLFAFNWANVARSTDGGQTWRVVNDALRGISELVVSPTYATDHTVFVLGGCGAMGLCRSTDGGEHWERIGGDPAWEWTRLAIAPNYPTEHTFFVIASQGIFRSTDGGVNWQQLLTLERSRALAISPAYAQDRKVYVEDRRGDFLRSSNAGETWQTSAQLSEYGNADCGVRLFAGAQNNTVGGSSTGTRNVISKNWTGICIGGEITTGNRIIGNYIGTDTSGLQPAGNIREGVSLSGGTDANRVGGSTFEERNVISANQRTGVVIWSSADTSGNVVSGNYIGLDAAGTAALGNEFDGVGLDTASGNRIGGDTTGERNVISGNYWSGVSFMGGGQNDILGNYIGTDASGTIALGNHNSGILAQSGVHHSRIEGNVLSGNRSGGLDFYNSGTYSNTVIANLVGVNATGTAALGNDYGIGCWGQGSYHVVRDNVVSGNTNTGINWLDCHHSTLADNRVGLGADGITNLGNGDSGIDLWGGATQNMVGPGNEVAYNRTAGIRVLGPGTLNNPITRNAIYRNGGLGIDNVWGSSLELPPPAISDVVTTTTTLTLTGTALAGLNIEVFSDDGGQGAFYEGDTTADASGHFTFVKGNNIRGAYLTTIAMDSAGNTSEFSVRSKRVLPPLPDWPPTCSGPRWSVLIYLNGDNNLDFWTFELFNRLEMAADNPCAQIVVLWDRSGVNDTVLYLVQHDERPYELATYTDLVNRWPRGELNMGDPQTLINFVTQAQEDFPNPRTFLSLVDHGNGWAPGLSTAMKYPHGGMSFDDSSGGAYLSTSNLAAAFGVITRDGASPLDIVFYDACSMSMIENAYPLRRFVRFLVASQNESFSSYPYDAYLEDITEATQPADLATAIVDGYHGSLSGYPHTLVALNLSHMTAVSQAVDGLARALLPQVQVYLEPLRTSFNSAQKFDENRDLRLGNTDAYMDLYHFAQLVKQNTPDAAVQAAAQGVLDAIGTPGVKAILRERHNSGRYWGNGEWWGLDNAHGLSIYLPLGERDWLLDYYNGYELSFAADTAWDELVREMVTAVDPPQRPLPLISDPTNRPGPLSGPRVYLPLLMSD